MNQFESMGLTPDLLKAINELSFETPTPVQEKVIPLLLSGQDDMMALAQTGTGKTAAYGLPLLQTLETGSQRPLAIILSPTRELCLQISNDLQSYARYMNQVKIVAVYGGAPIVNQIRQLRNGAQIVVATPGRLKDHIARKTIDLSGINTVILDEADEMLNMGFREEIDSILATISGKHKTWLFSATMPAVLLEIARKYMHQPAEITIGRKNATADNVQHIFYLVHEKDRYLATKRILDYNPDIYGIIFCRTRIETQEIASKLIADGYDADSLHGDLSQAQRDYVMNKFRTQNIRLLVATDVAARGLDVENLTHIIHYHLPDDPEIYTHRSGRTARAGKSGVSIAIINLKEKYRLKQIEKFIRKEFEPKKIPTGNEICKVQLLNLTDNIRNVTIDHELIDPLLPAIFEKLETLSKEDLIKHVISLEFNRLFQYYTNAIDLNIAAGEREMRKSTGFKKEERSPKGEYKKRKDEDRDSNFTRFFINLGKMDGLKPQALLSIINDVTRSRKIRIGRIDLYPKHSYFEAEPDQTTKILKSFSNIMINGRKINVEVAD